MEQSDAIEHEKTGLICDGNNLDEIYSSINSMLENKKYLEYGKNAKDHLSLNFIGQILLKNINKISKLVYGSFYQGLKNLIGILFGILAYLSFSILDATQKTLILYHSVFQLLLVKYFFVLFLSFNRV